MRMYMVNARQAKNLSQSEVARLCDMTRQYYGQLELGKKGIKIPLVTVTCLSRVLDIPLEVFAQDKTLMGKNVSIYHDAVCSENKKS